MELKQLIPAIFREKITACFTGLSPDGGSPLHLLSATPSPPQLRAVIAALW
jgi:hypothetical protein